MSQIKEYVAKCKPAPMREIADRLGVSRPHLYDFIEGRRTPSLETAKKIEAATDGEVRVSGWPHFAAVLDAVQTGAA